MSKNKKNKENLDKEIFPTQQEETKEENVEQTEVEEKEHYNLEKLEDCSCEKKENEEEILALNNQINALKEALLRNQAELQNYKRRKDEETERTMKYKNEEIIKELLSVVDNFERAIKMDDNDLSDEVSKFLAGFKLIYTNTINILNKFEVQEINAEGIEFDPNYHHAVLTEHDETKPAGVILEVLQKGYIYKDRVIRPAMVKVNE
ncbi:MAG: nucleotide exchange factor GrpE [Erysipelotrichaceae bacterium]|nr:nucleotide exchange factor GrpE [Erysipelotrichaceae bacterium]